MGADNWAICPKCNKEANDKYANAYGNVSEGEYLSLVRKVDDHEARRTFREDYEVYMGDDSKFYVWYTGHCTECNFKHRFEHNEEIEI